MKRIILLSIIFIFVLSTSSFSFDGDRKGFVLGGGLGVAAVSHWEVDVDFFDLDIVDASEDRPGLGLHIVIGGAFDEHNMLVYEANLSTYKTELLDEAVAQGFNGAAWYHYFRPAGSTFYTTLGLGFYHFKIGEYEATNPGGALLLGAGYEFAKHWQIGAYLSFGKTTDSLLGLEGDFEHANFTIMISGIAY